MKTVLAFCAVLGAGTSAFAQDMVAWPMKMELAEQAGAYKAAPGQTEWSSEFLFRYSMIGGNDGAGGKWDDDFKDGYGFRLNEVFQYYLHQSWSIGGYVSAGLDFFGAKSSGGSTADDWIIFPFTVGAQARAYFGSGWCTEGYLGFGFVSYP